MNDGLESGYPSAPAMSVECPMPPPRQRSDGFDVLILGAGPAGSAAAIHLARGGWRVALVDRACFPRDKVCGDALIPDAQHAFARLGLGDMLVHEAHWSPGIRIYAPDGTSVGLEQPLASLPRARLDWHLLETARSAGAEPLMPYRVVAPLYQGERIAGARLVHRETGHQHEVRAPVTLLATGACSAPLRAFGVAQRDTPSAVAARQYLRVPEDRNPHRELIIAFDAATLPGYGWIFPGPNGSYNVGVGWFHGASPRDAEAPNLRALWQRFLENFGPARQLMACAEPDGGLRGAPLRTGLSGSELERPGLMVIGEAAGTTYSLTGEGIGKALESGLAAAEVIREAGPRAAWDRLGPHYAVRFRRAVESRFRSYRRAQAWMTHPWVANLVAHRARRVGFVQRQLNGMLAESAPPAALFSARGFVRGLVNL